MEVSNQSEPGGKELIETVVSLTDLPEPEVREELDQILEMSGRSSGELTLDELRKAMLIYLEALGSNILEEGNESSAD